MYNVTFGPLDILKCTILDVNIHTAVRPRPPPELLSSQTEALSSLNTNSLFPAPPNS